jgi:hypothetical protein
VPVTERSTVTLTAVVIVTVITNGDLTVLAASGKDVRPRHPALHTPADQFFARKLEATSVDAPPVCAHCDSLLVHMVPSESGPAMRIDDVDQRARVVGACVERNSCKLHHVQSVRAIVMRMREVPVSVDSCTVTIKIVMMVADWYQ